MQGVPPKDPVAMDPLMLYNLADMHYQRGNIAEAEKAYLASGLPAAFNNLGVIAHSRRDYAGCIRCWVLSGNVDAVKNLERLLEEQGRSSEFPAILSKMDTPAAKHRLGRMHYERGSLERAEDFFRQAGSKEAWADLGVLMVQQARLDEAEQCFRIGKDAPFNLGLLFWQHCLPPRLGDAELCFLRSGTPQAWCNLGRIYESQSHWTRALEAYMRSGTEQSWVSAALLYLRNGCGREAEKLLKKLAVEQESLSAGYYLQNIYLARNHKRDAAALNLPPLTPEEQLKKHGVVQELAQQFRFAKITHGIPPLEEMQSRLLVERQKRRMIRISTFDEKDVEKLITLVPEEKLNDDVFLAAFRVRMECNHELQDVEVVEYRQGFRSEAAARHGAVRMDMKRKRQIQIRDWLIYGCSCTPRGGLFKSLERLPMDSESLNWPLRQVVLHPCYQMQTLELLCLDGTPKVVECGLIRDCEWSIKLWPVEPYEELWRHDVRGSSSGNASSGASSSPSGQGALHSQPSSGRGKGNYHHHHHHHRGKGRKGDDDRKKDHDSESKNGSSQKPTSGGSKGYRSSRQHGGRPSEHQK